MQPSEYRLLIDRGTLDQVIAHVRSGLPYESCGLLATVTNEHGSREVRRFFPGDNIDRSTSRYTMDPRHVAVALDEMDHMGWELGATVHSHPSSPAAPSVTDLREIFYPRAWMTIVSFASEPLEVRVWRPVQSARNLPVELALTIFPN